MQRFRNILVGIDIQAGALTPGSKTASEQALRLAAQTGAAVDFLHSTHLNAEDAPLGALPTLETVRAALHEAVPDHPQTSAIALTDERPTFAITRRVVEGRNDLVVVAKRNMPRRERKLGSVSYKLIRKCPAPVWVVKPEHPLRHRSILAATDLTPVGDLVTEFAAALAEADDCELLVAHAWQLPMELQLSAARLGDDEVASKKQEIADAASAHIRSVPAVADLGERAKLCVACNSPSRLLLEVVGRADPDLVVMGTISRGGVAGLLVGNTAERMLGRLDCSLLTVKPDDFVCPLVLD